MNIADAEDIIQDAVGRLEARCQCHYSALNAQEQIVCFAWLATQVINNGGFQYLFESYFEGDSSYEKTAAAFHEIGAKKAARAFDQALSCCGGAMDGGVDDRLSRYGALPQSERRRMDHAFMDAYDDIALSLVRYVERAFREGKIR